MTRIQFAWSKYFPWYFIGDLAIVGFIFALIAWAVK